MKYKHNPFHLILFFIGAVLFVVGFVGMINWSLSAPPAGYGGYEEQPTEAILPMIIGAYIEIPTFILILVHFKKHKRAINKMRQEEIEKRAKSEEENRKREFDRRYFNDESVKATLADYEAWKKEMEDQGVDLAKMIHAPRVYNDTKFTEPNALTRVGSKIIIMYRGDCLTNMISVLNRGASIINSQQKTKEYFCKKMYRETKVLSIDDVVYWHLTGEIEEKRSYSGGASTVGLAVTEAVWGTAAAVNKAMVANANQRSYTVDKRYIEILFNFETGAEPFETQLKEVDKVKMMLPEKMR